MADTKLEEIVHAWESNDGWQFADRDAERRFFFQAGQAAGMERAAEIAKETNFHRPDFMFAIRKEIKP